MNEWKTFGEIATFGELVSIAPSLHVCFWLDALNHSLLIFFLVHKLGGYDS